jgi:hypothetical protein
LGPALSPHHSDQPPPAELAAASSFEMALFQLIKQPLHIFKHVALVIFQSQNIVRLLVEDPFRNLGLAAGGINGDDSP